MLDVFLYNKYVVELNSLCVKNMAFSCIIIVMLTTGKTHFTLNFKLQKTCLTAIGWYNENKICIDKIVDLLPNKLLSFSVLKFVHAKILIKLNYS